MTISEALVEKEKIAVARAALKLAEHDLRLKGVETGWYADVPPACTPLEDFQKVKPNGIYEYEPLTRRSIIWLQVRLSPVQIMRTVMHEARHCWQRAQIGDYRFISDDEERQREEDARRYADCLLSKYGLRPYQRMDGLPDPVGKFVRQTLYGFPPEPIAR
jgi:hypothetical protein